MNIRDMKLPFTLLGQYELIGVMQTCKCESSITVDKLTICPVCGRHVVNLQQDKNLTDYPNQLDLELIRMFNDLEQQIKLKSEEKEEKEKKLEKIHGEVFDSSVQRKKPAAFPLENVIKGWAEGVQLMPVGSKFRFVVKPELGYKDREISKELGPKSTMIFEVELLGIL